MFQRSAIPESPDHPPVVRALFCASGGGLFVVCAIAAPADISTSYVERGNLSLRMSFRASVKPVAPLRTKVVLFSYQ